jgi:hypothetical protein
LGILLGDTFWGYEVFSDDSTSINSIKSIEVSSVIIDEISVRKKTDQGMDNVKDVWNADANFIAKFLGNLEAGNLGNSGVKIVKFRVVRREITQNQTSDIYLGEVPFDSTSANVDLSFVDGTQPNRNLIYTLIPVGENGIDGTPREISINGAELFNGIWLYDKDTSETLVFDKAIGSVGTFENSLVQGRTLIETFAPLPQVYNNGSYYHQFTLTSTFLPEEWESSGDVYLSILDKFIKQNKPFLVKNDNGLIFAGDISNIKTSTPQVTWKTYDYITVSVDFTETISVEDYMKDV